MKELTFRCRWLEVRVRIGFPLDAKPLHWSQYRVASPARTAELRDALLTRLRRNALPRVPLFTQMDSAGLAPKTSAARGSASFRNA